MSSEPSAISSLSVRRQTPSRAPSSKQRLIELAGKVGRLLDDVGSNRIVGNRDVLAAHLVEILRALVFAADEADVDFG